jgi:uncharacterized membrane protein YbhN (UPF0104 family)
MRGKLRRWWPAVKALVGLAILVALGRRFARDLARPELWEQPLQPGWLLPSALFYLAAIGLSAIFWGHLLRRLGQPAPAWDVTRAYYVSHLGKYVPGKALALVIRGALMRPAGAHLGLTMLTAFYEVLATMTSAALLAALLFAALDAGESQGLTGEALLALFRLRLPEHRRLDDGTAALAALLMAGLVGLPLLPRLFNRVARRMTPRVPGQDALPPPRLGLRDLAWGLIVTAPAWPLLGAAVGCGLAAVPGAGLSWDAATLARLTAGMGLAYVAGFVILVAPAGLGVREFLLVLLLTPELAPGEVDRTEARAQATLTVLLLRLAWTTAEVLLAGALYALGDGSKGRNP